MRNFETSRTTQASLRRSSKATTRGFRGLARRPRRPFGAVRNYVYRLEAQVVVQVISLNLKA